MKISKRLLTIAKFIEYNDKVADIGTDHALLPIYLIEKGICQRVIAGELNKGPFQAAVQNVKKAGFEGSIEIRLGNGLSILKPKEADTITIAGMGGATAVEILEAEPEVVTHLQKIAIQPMNDEEKLRKWFSEHNWVISDEDLIKENDKIYTIISAQPGQEQLSKEEILFGPVLIKNKHQLLKEKINKEIEHKRKIKEQIIENHAETVDDVLSRLNSNIADLERVLKCL